MRRLSGTRAILLLILVALVGVSIYFGIGYFMDRSDKDALADDIAEVQAQIAEFAQTYNLEELEATLAELQQRLTEAHFPMNVEHNIVHDYVMAAAAEAGVTFESWVAEENAVEQTVNGTGQTYRLFSYEATVSGTLDEMLDFLAELEANAPYDTIKLDEVELTYDSDTYTWLMEFTVQVYAQPE